MATGGFCYHVLNRGNARQTVFHCENDYAEFVTLFGPACRHVRMRILAYCIMPNHFHLVLWPWEDKDLGSWVHWLLTSHVRRHHKRYTSSGRLWQGRYKSFPIQSDEHLLTVMRYVERNALRANLVNRAEAWRWSSLRVGQFGTPAWHHEGPVSRPGFWSDWVNMPQTDAELEAIRRSVKRGAPFGKSGWRESAAERLGILSTLRPRGRPRKYESRASSSTGPV